MFTEYESKSLELLTEILELLREVRKKYEPSEADLINNKKVQELTRSNDILEQELREDRIKLDREKFKLEQDKFIKLSNRSN